MEEKTNRIVEIILSSVRPFKLMIGKILGVGAVGLTQLSIWLVLITGIYLGIVLLFGIPTDSANQLQTGGATMSNADIEAMVRSIQLQLGSLPWTQLLLSFVFYFVLGYVLYAALFAALGSAINDETDAQSLTLPVSLPIIIAMFILTAITEQPNSGLAFWSSMVPLFSPIIMPL